MKWTTEYPTQPGYYWLRNWDKADPEPRIAMVTALLCFYTCEEDWAHYEYECHSAEWFGPIQAPD